MGLLDSITEDQILGGLLGAGAASGAKGNFLARMAAGIGEGQKFGAWREQKARQRSQDEMQAEYRALQMKKAQMDMQREAAAVAQAQAKRDALPGLFAGQQIPGQISTPTMGGIEMFSQGSTQTPPRTVGSGQLDVMKALKAGFGADEITKLAGLSNLGKPKVSKIETVNVNGKPMKVGIDEYGQQVAQIGMEWRPLKTQDMGGYVGAFDETDPGAGMRNIGTKTQTAESIASNETSRRGQDITMRGQNMTDSRAREGSWTMNNDTGYMVNSRTGEYRLATGPDGKPADRPVKLTEIQGKATGFASRMQDAEKTLTKFEDKVSPSGVAMAGYKADFPSWMPGGQILGGAITAANRSLNPAVTNEAMAYQQAQENWVTANLRLESGAVIGPEEMQKEIQKYFPVPGDPKSVRDQKKAARAVAQRAVTAQAGPGVRLIPGIAGEQAPAGGPAPFKDQGKEDRYQEWKRRNMK